MQRRSLLRAAAIAAGALALFGCDPVLNVFGSFFPSWIVCITVGVALTGVARQVLVSAGLATHLGPPLLVYPSLGILLTLTTWLLFYR